MSLTNLFSFSKQKGRQIIYLAVALLLIGSGVWLRTQINLEGGNVATSITVVYKDGTEKTYDGSKRPFFILPERITVGGEDVSKIIITTHMTATWSGDLGSVSFDGSKTIIDVHDGSGDLIISEWKIDSGWLPKSSFEPGRKTMIGTWAIYDYEMDSVGEWGTYELRIRSEIQAKFSFTNGDTLSKYAENDAEFRYTIDADSFIQSMTVYVGRSVFD